MKKYEDCVELVNGTGCVSASSLCEGACSSHFKRLRPNNQIIIIILSVKASHPLATDHKAPD